jgi:hypothetical protein
MKVILTLAMAALGLSAHAGILAGPIVNPVNGHSYFLLSKNTWSNAEAEAIRLGGHLATIRNAGEQHWVFSTFGANGGALWIGLTDRDKVFTFTWTSGEPLLYTNWSDTQPDHGTGGTEYYTHMWPAGIRGTNPPPPGKWNDYADVDDLWGFPLQGVAEVPPASIVRLALQASSDTAKAQSVANLAAAASGGPELRAYTAIELIWPSETNKLYRIQWTPSLNEAQWLDLEPTILGTGTNVSVFDSTRAHPQGFYRLQVVQ